MNINSSGNMIKDLLKERYDLFLVWPLSPLC